MTTYEVGTTARFGVVGGYRERHADGQWRSRSGGMGSAHGDATARDLYTDITPPGPPLPAGTVLDPGKRYTLQSDPGDAIRILQSESGAWRDVTSYCIQWVVRDHEIVREIREPGSANQESRPEWDAVKSDNAHPYAGYRLGQLLAVVDGLNDDISDAREEADEARAECTRLNDLLTDSTADYALLDGALMSTQMALTTAERIRGQHFESWMRTVKERDEHVARTAESEHVREAQQSQIRALEAKVAAREMALKAAQAEISRGLQNKIPKQRGYADPPYTSALNSLFSQFTEVDWRIPPEAPPVDETAAGYFTD